MTSNHLLLYRLAELMLEQQQQTLAVDDLFDDEIISDLVKSIQIDSPYQQMLLEGVLTESVREEKLYVSFTVEGYFHFVLGEVIYNRTEGLGPKALKQIVEENKMNGAKEGVEQCLIRDVEKDELNRLTWMIDQNDSTLNCSIAPLVNLFMFGTNKKGEQSDIKLLYQENSLLTLQKILNNQTENDFKALIKSIDILRLYKKHKLIESIYLGLNDLIKPDTLNKTLLCLEAVDYLAVALKKEKLVRLLEICLDFPKCKKVLFLLARISESFFSISEFDFSMKCLDVILKSSKMDFDTNDQVRITAYNDYATIYDRLEDHPKAIKYQQKALKFSIENYGFFHSYTSLYFRNLGSIYSHAKKWKKSIENFRKSIQIERVLSGEYDENMAHSFVGLAVVYRNLKEFNEAIHSAEAGLKIYKEIFGERHSNTGTAMNNLGLIYYSMNNHEKASLFIEAAHQITLNNNGIVSHVSAISFNNLGSIKSSMGQYDEALTNFMHSRDIKMKLFGQKHLSIAHVSLFLGENYANKNDFLNAIKSIKKALKIYSINGDFIYKIKCHVLIGQYYKQLIDMKNTLIHYKKALKYCKEEFGENHPRTLSIKTIISSLTSN